MCDGATSASPPGDGLKEVYKEMFHNKLQRIVATVLLAVCVFSGTLSAASATRAAQQRISFELRSLDDVTVTSQGLQGQIVVLAFGAAWLPLSRKQMEGLRDFAAKNAANGVKVYWVSVDSDKAKSKNYASDEDLRAFARKYSINVPVLRDVEGVVSQKFGVDQLPSLVVLDRQGEVVGSPIGGLDPDGNVAEQLKEPVGQALARR